MDINMLRADPEGKTKCKQTIPNEIETNEDKTFTTVNIKKSKCGKFGREDRIFNSIHTFSDLEDQISDKQLSNMES